MGAAFASHRQDIDKDGKGGGSEPLARGDQPSGDISTNEVSCRSESGLNVIALCFGGSTPGLTVAAATVLLEL